MDFQQQAPSETQTEQTPEPNQQMPEVPVQNPMPNQGNAATPPQQPSQGHTPAQQQPGQGNAPTPWQQPGQGIGGVNGQPPYRNPYPYGSNPAPNGYPNMDPYYNRSAYRLPSPEPGSSLANAAMVLGIIAIASCFTFTVYPPFILGSIAIVLALLSKGRRPKFFSKAKTGIICAASGFIINTALVVCAMVLLSTDSDFRNEVNRTFEEQYGISFDEVIEEIMEENDISY
ncbi:MAG: hypothetical protein NC231_13060 [Bacillus sp. (in: Bacteria)]|nr:hypothetical protein [Bacillus sp. (in: firmicutes)]MCM1426908.1 hypothetical protein [Eubacterium sp.]